MPAPREYRSISKDALLRKYMEGNWAERRTQYKCEEKPSGDHKAYRRWRDEEGFTMLYLREYNNPGEGGQQVVVHELREDDIFYQITDPNA